jgi:hypothetical protein
MEVDTPSFPKSEQVIATRSGDVLIKQTLLKADHFPKYVCMLRWPAWASCWVSAAVRYVMCLT